MKRYHLGGVAIGLPAGFLMPVKNPGPGGSIALSKHETSGRKEGSG